jgi:type III restriction enzyme
MRTILFRVFGTKPCDGSKCLRLDPAPLYGFVINNRERLRKDIGEALAAELKLTTSKARIVEKEFRFPHEWLCFYSKTARNQNPSAKNVYDGYPLSAITSKTRSSGEVKFEKWCEGEPSVEWVYRNGDKGEEFFSIVYVDNSGHQRLFFPDYIVSINGKVWVVEVKGGWNGSGRSENIDPYARKKAFALNAYAKKHGLRGAFVRHEESEDVLLAAEGGYDEDANDSCWQPIEEVVAPAVRPKGSPRTKTSREDLSGDYEAPMAATNLATGGELEGEEAG